MSDLSEHPCKICGQPACATVGSSKATAYRCVEHFFTDRERLLLFIGFVQAVDLLPEGIEPCYPDARPKEVIASDKIQTVVSHWDTVDMVEVEGVPGGERGQGDDRARVCTFAREWLGGTGQTAKAQK
jgi:hypothetical protein